MRIVLIVVLMTAFAGEVLAQAGRVSTPRSSTPTRPASRPSSPPASRPATIIIHTPMPHRTSTPRPHSSSTPHRAAPSGVSEDVLAGMAILGAMAASNGILLAMTTSGAKQQSDADRAMHQAAVLPPDPAPQVHPQPSSSGGGGVWIFVALLGFVGVVVAVGVAKSRSSASLAARRRFRVVATPPGEAPEHVRRAWVGLELPFAPGMNAPHWERTKGIVSDEEGDAFSGCVVMGNEAVALLEKQSPEAAEWWRDNAPQVLQSGYQLVFPVEVCRPVGSK